MLSLPYSGGGSSTGASTALDNLASVAINTSLISDTDNTDDLGSAAKMWKDLYVKGTAYVRTMLAAPAAAAPIALAVNAGGARGGTDTDTAGANATIGSGQGTGAGAASSIIFQTPTVGGAGSTAQTMATRFTVATTGITATVPMTAESFIPTSSTLPAFGMYKPSATDTLGFSNNALEMVSFHRSLAAIRTRAGFGIGWVSANVAPSGGTLDTRLDRLSAGVVGVSGSATTDAGGFQPAQSANGATIQIRAISEELTLSLAGTTTDTTANLLPANSLILAVVARITTNITVATDWQLGDPTTAGRFTAANSTLTAGTTDYGFVHASTGIASATTGIIQTSAAKVRVTTTGTPGAGAIRITVFYAPLVAPTS